MVTATQNAQYLAKYGMLENQTIGRVFNTANSEEDKRGTINLIKLGYLVI